jgi:hypothetical protein
MEKLIKRLRQDYPDVEFIIGASHCWSPANGQIMYTPGSNPAELAGVLHELGHARLKHHGYARDLELLQKEMDAWQEARQLCAEYGILISEDHIQDCLDTYRDWLHKRSLCPSCRNSGLQETERHYVCLNCGHTWHVTAARFCRPYRRSK